MSTTDISEGPRTHAAEVSERLEALILEIVERQPGITVGEVRSALSPRLNQEQGSLLLLAVYNLINSKRLELSAKRELKKREPEPAAL